MGLRHDKVIAALKREISNIVQYELKDSRLGFVTIMRVDLTDDLKYAKVFFSVLGEEKEQKSTKKALESAKPFIRCLIGERMKLRFVPEITFKLDHSVEYSISIQKAIDRIKTERENHKL